MLKVARGNGAEFRMGLRLPSCPQKELYTVIDSKPPAARMHVQVIEIKGIAIRRMLNDKPLGSRCVGKLQGREADSILELLSSASNTS
jgi:hypothetical protein